MYAPQAIRPRADFVGAREAQRISGISAPAIYRMALVGQIDHETTLDGRPVFGRASLEAIRAQVDARK